MQVRCTRCGKGVTRFRSRETNSRTGELGTQAMKIKLSDHALLADLLAFLRKEGCVAYYEGGGIEAVRPHSFGEREAAELRLP